MKLPELVLPAGNLEKLKTAILFGADAVYLGGKEFSLRAYADNFTLEEINDGLTFARRYNKKVYVTVNILAHNRDLQQLPAYLEKLEEIQVDGLIISDPGIIKLSQRYAPSLPLTLSTQASVSNYEAAAFYRDLGVKRIVLARELSLEEIQEIKERVDIEIEMFIHGAMCVSYSGRCLLSHYMTGRSANYGACAHPCRYRYALVEEKRPGQYYPIEEDQRGSYILNSRDLCLLEYIPKLIDIGIESFKVEGRMKNHLYVASVASVYRQAIDRYTARREEFAPDELNRWIEELTKTATRPFTNGFIESAISPGTVPGLIQDIDKEEKYERADFCGIVRSYNSAKNILQVEQRANFGPGDPLQLMVPGGEILPLDLQELYDEEFNPIDRARHARQTVYIPYLDPLSEYTILRRG
ncbi:MAG: U32 family peptidase [Syntrophomonadaceae bacterium]|nr:U32 family peptidase [Syntrophomonadaceae bacterium]